MSAGQVLLESRKFRVERFALTGRDGVARPHDLIIHPGAAVILPRLDDGRLLFIRNYRLAAQRELLELPAGTLDPPETPLDCARRELTEETGYVAARIEPLLSYYSTPGICNERMHAFLATGLTPGPARLEPDEHIQPQPLTIEEALRSARDGRIQDAKSLVTLLYYDRFVRGLERS
ncbi:ADP-ribose pyrophosphatase [Phycisphaerae bacterium RAS1]|nr:ADP-ribose pyrophosphatase [Phycisphaerae bacterium RAS1]